MHEYSSVSASSYDPGALVSKLNEAAAEGWDVVAIVPTGGDVSAFLRRGTAAEVSDGEPTGEMERADAEAAAFREAEAAATAGAGEAWTGGGVAAAEPVAEPVGGGTIETIDVVDVTEVPAVTEPAAAESGREVDEPAGWAVAAGTDSASPAAEEAPVAETRPAAVEEPPPAPAPAPAPEPTPAPIPEPAPVVTTPAGWYPDPSTRYELRYWDGTQWTEHVARQGQQFTDPPVR